MEKLIILTSFMLFFVLFGVAIISVTPVREQIEIQDMNPLPPTKTERSSHVSINTVSGELFFWRTVVGPGVKNLQYSTSLCADIESNNALWFNFPE